MKIPSFNEIKKVSNSRYELVMLVSKRARKLVDGEPPLVETTEDKPVSTAMEEILEGKIVFHEPMSDRQYAAEIEKERQEMLARMKAEIIHREGEIEA